MEPAGKKNRAIAKFVLLALLLIVGGGVGYALLVKEPPPPPVEPPPPPPPPEPPETHEILPTPPAVNFKISGKITVVNVGERFLKLKVTQPASREFKVAVNERTVINKPIIPNVLSNTAKKGSLAEIRTGDSAEIIVREPINDETPGTVNAVFIQPVRL